ncbi:MAG TPA: alcohol dehydrogenase catalytic domain-containing protein [Pilimelia sp.]|nr:alcohol dehydrogenase catalytic domain-containing protein [Pilimelia sp.]
MSISYDVLVREQRRLRLHRWELPSAEPPPVRVLLVGVCGTDLQILRQARPDPARVLGHEGLAEVTADDGTVRHVVFNPVDPDNQDDILGHSRDGLLRQLLPAARTGPLFDVDPALPADIAVLIEPLAAVLYGWELMTTATAVRDLGVWGAGSTAVLTALVGELRGVSVRLIHDRPTRLPYLHELGALQSTDLRPAPAGAADLDAAVLCVPREAAAAALSQAVAAVRPGGAIDLFGGFTRDDRHPELPGVDLGAVRRGNVCGRPRPGRVQRATARAGHTLWLTGHRGTADRHFHAAQQLLLRHPERFGRVLTHVVSLRAAAALLPRLADSSPRGRAQRERCLKVAVDPFLTADRRAPDLTRTVAALRRAG